MFGAGRVQPALVAKAPLNTLLLIRPEFYIFAAWPAGCARLMTLAGRYGRMHNCWVSAFEAAGEAQKGE
jgi:hypothetical protein